MGKEGGWYDVDRVTHQAPISLLRYGCQHQIVKRHRKSPCESHGVEIIETEGSVATRCNTVTESHGVELTIETESECCNQMEHSEYTFFGNS